MFVQVMEYFQPVFLSYSVRFFRWRRDGLTRRAIHRRAPGQFPARVVRPVISATSLSSSGLPSWPVPGFHASAGTSRLASSSAAVITQPQVKSRIRRGGGHRQQVLDELVAGPGPVDADQDLAPEPGRDLPDGRDQHVLVIGEGV